MKTQTEKDTFEIINNLIEAEDKAMEVTLCPDCKLRHDQYLQCGPIEIEESITEEKTTEEYAVDIMIILLVYKDDFTDRPRNKETLSEWCKIPTERIIDASVYLCSKGFASMRGSIIEPTEDGLQWIRGLSVNPHFLISISTWKEEVLTGITSGGNQTKIDNAVLQKKHSFGCVNKTEDRVISSIVMGPRDTSVAESTLVKPVAIPARKISKNMLLKMRVEK